MDKLLLYLLFDVTVVSVASWILLLFNGMLPFGCGNNNCNAGWLLANIHHPYTCFRWKTSHCYFFMCVCVYFELMRQPLQIVDAFSVDVITKSPLYSETKFRVFQTSFEKPFLDPVWIMRCALRNTDSIVNYIYYFINFKCKLILEIVVPYAMFFFEMRCACFACLYYDLLPMFTKMNDLHSGHIKWMIKEHKVDYWRLKHSSIHSPIHH